MSHAVLLPIAALLSGLFPSYGAQDPLTPARPDVRAIVQQVAFDPATYFPSPYIRDLSVVRITYTGDDYGWPVYSIAIAEGCVDGETIPQNNCASRLRARMGRAPGVIGATRLRQAGAQLVSQVRETGATSEEDVREALSGMGLEWLEADVRACPGALATLAKSAEAIWVPGAVANPTSGDEMSGLVLHADIVRVEFQQYARLTTYSGWLADRSPAAWAVEMASVLEPCWRPMPNDPPWLLPGGG